ncbi:MAG: GAF domain-containing protein, partial [Chloroflexi bacterium]|nr:GAF domain-containing protein [Chloroflexota bacterium]
ERRGRQLEATAQVAREAAAIRSLDELLTYTTQLISEHFGFYHTGIFLLDNARKYAVLLAANSEGGQHMLAQAHKLEVGQTGVVGYVADTGLPRIALDVGADAHFFGNPNLPTTRSEVALPLKIRGRVIGVLDVQSAESAAFAGPDVEVLQILADQVALAIENARLLEQSQDVIQELQSVHGEQMIQGWRQQLRGQTKAYHFDLVRVVPATQAQIEAHDSLVNHPLASTTEAGHILTLPIALRGRTLGSITLRRDLDENPWSPDDLDLARDTVAQIAVALDNARMLDETRRRAERERLVGEITSRMQETLNVETVLKTAVSEIYESLALEQITIRLAEDAVTPLKETAA